MRIHPSGSTNSGSLHTARNRRNNSRIHDEGVEELDVSEEELEEGDEEFDENEIDLEILPEEYG